MMMTKDPIKHVEDVTYKVHDSLGKYAEPVLKRYPLLFSFLIVFGLAAVLHGFELVADQIPLFYEHPTYLMIVGVVVLFFTGTLYKSLSK